MTAPPASAATIRPATDEDWPRIWPFFEATVRAGETYAYPLDLTLETGRHLWMADRRARPSYSRTAASSSAAPRWGPTGPGRGDHVGTASFMVAPEARGRGVGRALGEYVVQWHRDQGYRGIQFNAVVETNTAAVRSVASLGFEIVGTVPGRSAPRPTAPWACT